MNHTEKGEVRMRNRKLGMAVVLAAAALAGVKPNPTHAQSARVNGAPELIAQANPNPTAGDKAVGNGALNTAQVPKSEAPGAPTAKIVATPAIWKVKGTHGTVYLFGTIHVMKPEVDWQTAKVKQAFDASGTVYVEVANLDDQSAVMPLAARFGMDVEHPLSKKLTADDVSLLDTAVKAMGMPGEAMLEPMKPWLVSVAISMLPMMKAGYDPQSGVDVVLLKQAKDAGKKLVGFETLDEQLHFLADAPETEQVRKLHEELAEMDKDTAVMNEMVTAWEKGDVAKIAELENGELKTKHPDEYQTLVVDRNTKWAATLDGLLKDPTTGDVFVAVGAAHLAGDDSVVEMLKKDGWKVTRD